MAASIGCSGRATWRRSPPPLRLGGASCSVGDPRVNPGSYSPNVVEEEFCVVRCSNLRAPPRRGGRTSRRLSTMGVTLPNFATNRARKRSKVLRLVTLNFVENFFVENFSSARLELFLLWLLSHTKPKNRGEKERGL